MERIEAMLDEFTDLVEEAYDSGPKRTALLTAISDALAEGRKDRERLDWLQEIDVGTGRSMLAFNNIRQAIDEERAARAETGEAT